MTTKLEIATQILAAMAPAIAADVIAESKRTGGEEGMRKIAKNILAEIEGGKERGHHIAAIIAFKLATDLVDLTIKADAGEAAKK